jgi:TolA-binding protein
MGGGGSTQLQQLQAEIADANVEISSLEEFSRQMFLEVTELRQEKERVRFSRTWQGMLFDYSAYFFSGYCIYKIAIVRNSTSRTVIEIRCSPSWLSNLIFI